MFQKVIRIHISSLIFVLLLLPHFKIPYLAQFDAWDLIFNVLRIVSALVTIVLFVLKKTKLRMEVEVFLFLIFQLILLFSTVVNGASLYSFVNENCMQITVVLLICIYVDSWENIVSILMFLAEILVYVNLFFVITVPNGLYISTLLRYHHNWILGYKNQFICFFFVFFIIAMSYKKITGNKMRSTLLILGMIISLILAKSTTSIIAFFIMVTLTIIGQYCTTKLINPILLTIAYLLATFAIMLNGSLISLALGKGSTLTGRTYIWNNAIRYALESPIIGNGIISEKNSIFFLRVSEATSAHNTLIQMLCNGGILAIVSFAVFNFFLIKKLYQYRSSYYGIVIGVTFFAMNIAGLAEYYKNPIVYAVYGFVIVVDKLSQGKTIEMEIDNI